MDSNEEQNNNSANGTAQQNSGTSRTAQIAHMSLYERQAVQALQALQRQPNAAQYFQQLMLQQQISSAQLQNLAAVQQATLAASRQSNTPSNSGSQTASTVNLSTTSAGGTTPRPHGPPTSATTTALNQSVLIGGNSTGQGQMYLRVNRSLRAPLASQFIFMPGGTATATVATVTQAQPQQPHEAAPANGGNQTDNDQVQNLALHHASTPRTLAVKSELPERKDCFSQQQNFGQPQQQQVQPQQQATKPFNQQPNISVKTGNAAAMTVTPAASVAPSPSSSALPLSQLLLSPSSTPVILVPTSSVTTSSQGYPIASVTPKTNMNTQTLVVQPLQQANATSDKGPVPIQPKTPQGHRLPVQLPPPRLPTPILPAPPSSGGATGGQGAPHVPVQLVGARQNTGGGAQAVALAQVRSNTVQEQTAGTASVSNNNNVTNMTKPVSGSLKRKSDCDAPSDITSEPLESLSMKDAAPPLSPAPKDSAPPAVAAFSSPPTLSLPPPLSRVGLGDKERPPLPQAVVKPQVLTHLIEGFVIQEGAEPFPVAGLFKDRDFSLMALSENGPALLKCEYCGNLAPASQFRGSKRFCSNTCAKRYNVSCSQHFRISRGRSGAGLTPEGARRRGAPRRSISDTRANRVSNRHLPIKCHSESSHSEEVSSDGEDDSASLSPTSSRSGSRAEAPQSDCSAPGSVPLDGGSFLSSTPAQWSVEEVCRFISSLQGCEELAAHFLSQEIDGQALLLLREDHLISTMNIKLGPALKICASINSLRE
ncbi:polyhomeotic-like protein 1 [Periophthalmus magnuspinnatus]|uniref:polyhomeotic-like protein 1 n=1 Tax=Periophthalmus magnuspinnatus TaxID=409849 RepID=UPI00145B89AB|nr:polyhomeotic-like protein 1 [Periophthalmus magnuspinnatus]